MKKKYYVIKTYHKKFKLLEKRYEKYFNIICDIGLVLVTIGFLIWSLVAFGILGQNRDILSNSFFSIGTFIAGIGTVLVGIRYIYLLTDKIP